MKYFILLDKWLWQALFVFLVGIGCFLTYKLRGLQFRCLWSSLKLAFTSRDDNSDGDISHFQSLMTAIAGTIGIGNIAGVATAIAAGGLGSLFWLWITSFLGMAIKYSEALLAIRYRVLDKKGEMSGGPMYYIDRGLKWKGVAVFFAIFGVITTLFTGNIVQSHSIAHALDGLLGVNIWVVGLILAACTGLVLLKGIKSIGRVASYIVPFMTIFYILGSLIILAIHFERLPGVVGLIFTSAFTGQAAVGGFLGSTMMLAVQMGVSRGIFSNESGLGSAPIAAAAARTDSPTRQALISMTGGFLSTVVCTFTGLVIAVTNVLGQLGSDGKVLNGSEMTLVAFGSSIPYGGWIVVVGSIFFGYSTIVGWSYYGEKCCEYLFGSRSIFLYRLVYCVCVLIGVGIPINVVWTLADIANACMAFPNLMGVLALVGVVVTQTDSFFQKSYVVD